MAFSISLYRAKSIVLLIAIASSIPTAQLLYAGEVQVQFDSIPDAKTSDMVNLTISEIYNITWSVARNYYNREVSVRAKNGPLSIEPLSEKAFSQPTAIFLRSQGMEVLYGGSKSGPTIRVFLSKSGSVRNVTASHTSK